ncbi:hypothetical protein [Microbacterium aurantiacum]|uniref:hypothetical protein n=1 Tax=Microbacterium aurantiacum TaxID=162393 RepID=UPI0011AFCEAD|nr:hypothetical protein [Microbacterium aurantiacum]
MSWRRTHGRALAALLVAATATVGVHLWFDVLQAGGPEERARILAEGTTEIGGHELTLISARSDEFEAPAGSKTLSVRLDARSDVDAAPCGSITLTETSGKRSWIVAQSDVDTSSDADARDAEATCGAGSPFYRILSVFLLPDDATGPFWLDVPVGVGEIARFRVEL